MTRVIVENIVDNVTLRCRMVVLRGYVSPVLCSCVGIVRIENNRTNDSHAWPIRKGHFVGLARLLRGTNILTLTHNNVKKILRVNYQPVNTNYFVRPVYIICKDDTGHFQAPYDTDNSIKAACDRIKLAAEMLQLFVSETLNKEGLGRKTFNIENNSSEEVVCHVFHTSLTRNEAHKLDGRELWRTLACELMESKLTDKEKSKFLAFMSFTEYKNPNKNVPKTHHEVLQLTKGHTALGGGGLALFGTGCLHTWARSIEDIMPCFTDLRYIDKTKLMDDSAGRGQFWSCYSTSLGAVCHELGHTFDLGHNPSGIMARGFDDICKFFILPDLIPTIDGFTDIDRPCKLHDNNNSYRRTKQVDISVNDEPKRKTTPAVRLVSSLNTCPAIPLQEPPVRCDRSLPALENCEQGEFGGAYWYRSSAVILANHRWLNPTTSNGSDSTLELKGNVLTSASKLEIIEIRDDTGCTIQFWDLTGGSPKNVFRFNPQDLQLKTNKSQLTLVAEDNAGNILKTQLELIN